MYISKPSPSRRWSMIPHLIMWVVQNDLLLKRTIWKGGKRVTSQLHCRNLTNTASARGSKPTTVLSPVGSKYSYYIMKAALYPWAFPPPNPQAQSNHKKSIRLIPVEGQSTKYLIGSPQNCQDHQQGKTKKLSQPRGVYADVQLNVTWNPGTAEGYLV